MRLCYDFKDLNILGLRPKNIDFDWSSDVLKNVDLDSLLRCHCDLLRLMSRRGVNLDELLRDPGPVGTSVRSSGESLRTFLRYILPILLNLLPTRQ